MDGTFRDGRSYGQGLVLFVLTLVTASVVLGGVPSTPPQQGFTGLVESRGQLGLPGVGEFQDTASARSSIGENLVATPLSQDGSSQGPPSHRQDAAMAWDPASDSIILFGGINISAGTPANPVPNLNDTWSFSNGRWTELHPASSPPAIAFAAFAYDANDSALILFGGEVANSGGNGVNFVNSTWEFSAGTWTNVSGPVAPSPRVSAAVSPDPLMGGVVLFGGLAIVPANGTNGTPKEASVGDTWTFVKGSWANITGLVGFAPPARYLAGMTYDSALSEPVLFGGWQNVADSTPVFNDTWLLGPGGWTNETVPGSPPPEGGMGFTYLAGTSSVLMFGGWTPEEGQPASETWTYSSGLWTRLAPGATPPGTFGGALADDPSSGYGVLVVGQTEMLGVTAVTWIFQDGNWSVLGANGSLPTAGPSEMVYDGAAGKLLTFSLPYAGATSGPESTWAYNGTNWSRLDTIVAPSTRDNPAVVYDSTDGYVLFYGGSYQTDTWAFLGDQWTQLHPATHPPASDSAGIAYDARDGYVVYFDGTTTWKWNAGNWTELSPATEPNLGGRAAQVGSMTYDVTDGYVLLVQSSNSTCAPSGTYCLETWAFGAGQWKDLTSQPTNAPPALLDASVSYDSATSQVVMFGGYCPWITCAVQGGSNDTWLFVGGVWSLGSPASAPSPRAYAAMAFDPIAGNLLLFGGLSIIGQGPSEPLADAWAYNGSDWSQVEPALRIANQSVDVGVADTISAVELPILGTPSYTYSGLPPGCPSANASSLRCDSQAAGTYLITVSVSYVGVVPSAASASIAVQPRPAISTFVGTATEFVLGNSTTLSVRVAGGSPPFAYLYSGLPPGCGTSVTASLACTPSGPGNYTVSVRVTDRFGESANASLSLQVRLPGLTHTTSPLAISLYLLLAVGLGVGILGTVAAIGVAALERKRARREGEALVAGMRTLHRTRHP